MKLMIFKDTLLGGLCAENLSIDLSHKWKNARAEKFEDLIDLAAQKNVSYMMLFGRIFGEKRVTESVIDRLFAVLRKNVRIQVLAFLKADEYGRLSYRSDCPQNLHLICTQTSDSYTDDNIALRMEKGDVELQLGSNDAIWIRHTANEQFTVYCHNAKYKLPSFEPVDFENAAADDFGYDIWEWSDAKIERAKKVRNQKFAFQTVEIHICPADGQKEILHKINNALKKIQPDTFLRVSLTGRSAFGLTVNSHALEEQLRKRVFFAEVYDNTVMDIDERDFENDISLSSEFVRLALQDESLSELERNRIISCGWNALNCREVTGE